MNKKIKVDDEDHQSINKKSIIFIAILLVLGLITGLILSALFIEEANQKIDQHNQRVKELSSYWENSSYSDVNWSDWQDYMDSLNTTSNSIINASENNIYNSSWNWSDSNYSYDPYLKQIDSFEVLLPSLGVVFVSMTTFLLGGLIITYANIFRKSKSRYILGLELVLVPLFLFSLFLINTIRSLYFASAIQYDYISDILGFGIGGLGSMISIISIIEIFGLCILLYLSRS
jgi:cytochrome b subunit of formate dehydrogenase